MHLLFALSRGLLAFVLSLVCIGGGIAIPLVAVARSSSSNLFPPTLAGLFLVVFGGFLYLRLLSFRSSFRLQTSTDGLAFEIKSAKPLQTSLPSKDSALLAFLPKLFGLVALVFLGLVCIAGGVALCIVALVRGSSEGAFRPVLGGALQAAFGGYLALSASDDPPWLKASGDLQRGFSLEVKSPEAPSESLKD